MLPHTHAEAIARRINYHDRTQTGNPYTVERSHVRGGLHVRDGILRSRVGTCGRDADQACAIGHARKEVAMHENERNDIVSELCEAWTAAEMVADHLRWAFEHAPRDRRLENLISQARVALPCIQTMIDYYAMEVS